jgi:hypothetical protein
MTPISVCRLRSPTIPTQPLPPAIERKIKRRWAEWLPWATIEAKRRAISSVGTFSYAELMSVYQDTHRRTLARLLLARVKWLVIRVRRLDNPIESEETRERQVASAIERSQARYAGHARGRKRRHDAHES